MNRLTFTGSLLAASLAAGAVLTTIPSAQAAPTFVNGTNISQSGNLPTNAQVAMSEDGSAVATWMRDGRVRAAAYTDGSWTAPEFISDPGEIVNDPAITMNDKGEAAVAWIQDDSSNEKRLAVSRLDADHQFDGWEYLGAANTLHVAAPLSAALDNTGKLFVAYRATNNGSTNQVKVSTEDKAGNKWNVTLSDNDAFTPDIAVNASGQALLAWFDAEGGSSVVQTRRNVAGSNGWQATKSVSTLGAYAAGQVQAAISDNGSGSVAFAKQDLDGDYRAVVAKSNTNNTITGGNYLSPAGYTATGLSLAQNDKGEALLAFDRVGGGNYIGYTQRSEAGNWTTAVIVNSALANVTLPQAAISDSGFAFIGWDDDKHQKAVYRDKIYKNMSSFDSGASKYVSNGTRVGIDKQGNVLYTGILEAGDPGEGIVTGKFLDTAGPTSTVTAPSKVNSFGKIVVTRTAKDRFSNVTTHAIRVRTAVWNGAFGAPKTVVSGSTADKFEFTPQAGRTYCFSSLAKDSVGNVGAWSAEKCTTTPLDDRAGVIAKGFKRAKASTSYLGTYSIAKKKNAVISFQHVKAKRIAVVVTKVAKGGKIKVSFGGTKIGTYNLKGSGNKQLVAVKTFSKLKSGTLVIKVISPDGKVVRVDGVIISK